MENGFLNIQTLSQSNSQGVKSKNMQNAQLEYENQGSRELKKEIADKLAESIVDLHYENLSSQVIQQAKLCILDFLGVALAGSRVGLAPIMTNLICSAGGMEESTVIGIGHAKKVPVFQAALLNGVMGETLDMDDGHRYANAHPGVTIIPAALALAEKENATSHKLLESIVAGYETMIRIAWAINPSHLQRGFHTTGTVGPFGAAAACGKVLGLSIKQMRNALAIAGLQGAGLLQVTESGQIMKPLHSGRAAQSGVFAAILAGMGAVGPYEIFEGEKGFFKAFSDSVDVSKILDGLGDKFEILRIYFKMHAACRHVHPALDAMMAIVRDHGITAEEIESIEVSTYPVACRLTGRQETTSGLGAKFSLPVSLALLLIYGKAGVEQYSAECVRNPAVRALADRVLVQSDEWRADCYPAKRGAAVKVNTPRGSFGHEIDIPKGDPENPFTLNELLEKYMNNAVKVLPLATAEAIKYLVMSDADCPVREIMAVINL